MLSYDCIGHVANITRC